MIENLFRKGNQLRVNKYGLNDTISSPIKRAIRQRCGFGCVNCGNALYQYEHLDPTFANAIEHNAEHIVLLCGSCHDRVTRKLLSKETIKLRSKNPFCKQKGFSFGPFDLGLVKPTIKIGTVTCHSVKSLIHIDGESIFSIQEPECEDAPFRINTFLSDRDGNEILKIVDNEWFTTTSNWDVEVVGQRITIRKDIGDISLVIRTEAPHNLIIERLEMSHRGVKISCLENKNLRVITPSGQVLTSSSMKLEDCKVGFNIEKNSLNIGVGGGSVYIGSMTIEHIGGTRNTIDYKPSQNKLPTMNTFPFFLPHQSSLNPTLLRHIFYGIQYLFSSSKTPR